MKIELIAAGTKPPRWIHEGFETYQKRIKGDCQLTLKEFSVAKRHKSGAIAQYHQEEERLIRDQLQPRALIVALDKSGRSFSTEALAASMESWMQEYPVVQCLIGGPDGLAPQLINDAGLTLSFSPMTFPHFLMRVLFAEQLYRAWSVIHMHPYHK
ncbi:MAG: 23S rRNA (pseudouridine(1915)-N(3))-methyltransferase RlmH [Pseudomonadales bacterium]|jgi:23S rRNA (pseudouridine1915-N3)-methyltransferase